MDSIAHDPARRTGERAPRVGLVLGGGGAVGAAYHAGALAALENDLGWDPRAADVIVGTSAGSIVGALLRRASPRVTSLRSVSAPSCSTSAHASSTRSGSVPCSRP